jgi:hypothetical protein
MTAAIEKIAIQPADETLQPNEQKLATKDFTMKLRRLSEPFRKRLKKLY